VVVFAGPNGVGKTNINNALLQLARNPAPNTNIWMTVEATDEEERTRWGKPMLDTRQQQDAAILRKHLQRNQRRNRYQGSFLNFDSDRSIRNIQNYGFNWDVGNPLAEDLGWDIGLKSLHDRYNDVRHSIFRIVEGQRRDIADQVLMMQHSGTKEMKLNFPDVIEPFRAAFWQLLAPKKLVEVSVRNQQLYYEYNGAKLSLDTLSSGEKEVVNIVFDFLLRGPQHCVVLFDEPELHLHPELSYKLLQTLSGIGTGNQFIFSTHSPEIISASLENTVVFVTPARGPDDNQAIIVHRDDGTHHALQTLGQSIGVISLGKNLVLIEGDETSLDKQTYGAILQSDFPEFILVPVGGKGTIRSFDDIRNSILNRTIWGVDFYLLCDRDAVNSLGKDAMAATALKKIKQLPRYHLENYFLDEYVLSNAFASMEPADSWLRSPRAIREKIREIAVSVVPYATALNVAATVRESVGNISVMPKGAAAANTAQDLAKIILERVKAEGSRVALGLDARMIESLVIYEYSRLDKAVKDDDPVWQVDLPGRPILNKFAAYANIQVGRLKQLYLTNADKPQTFGEIIAIFQSFRDGK
jgi:ABC-type cobalamin/Fe3+-siderophores transport system ATPase subunit/molybdopterin converting factor small subunit